MTNLRGKIALVTGASAGIGEATALLLAAQGVRVFAAARRMEKLQALAAAAAGRGWRVEPLQLDVTDQASIERAARHISQATGGYDLDILVNNAGYGQIGPLEEIPLDALRTQFETNVFGLVALIQRFVPRMRERRYGRIVNVSSVGGRLALPLAGAYSATKYAVEAISDSLRIELARWNIGVVVIEPGAIATEFSTAAAGSMRRSAATAYGHIDHLLDGFERGSGIGAPPESVARAIVRAVASASPPARKVVPGFYAPALRLVELLPTRLVDGVMKLALRALERNPARASAAQSTE